MCVGGRGNKENWLREGRLRAYERTRTKSLTKVENAKVDRGVVLLSDHDSAQSSTLQKFTIRSYMSKIIFLQRQAARPR